MHPIRQMEAIRSTLDDGEEGAAEIRAAARRLERTVPIDEILAAVVDPDFPMALMRASLGCEPAVETAWLTLAAAGSRRARQVLAWRASQLLDPAELAGAAQSAPDGSCRFELKATAAKDAGAAAAWRLLAFLSGKELGAMVRARPALAGGAAPAVGIA